MAPWEIFVAHVYTYEIKLPPMQGSHGAHPGTPYFSFLSVWDPLHCKYKQSKGSEKIYVDPLISQPGGGLYHLNYLKKSLLNVNANKNNDTYHHREPL